jgi:hypothetical protein
MFDGLMTAESLCQIRRSFYNSEDYSCYILGI